MNTIVSAIRLAFTADDKPELTLTLAMNRKEAQIAFKVLQEILDKGKSLWMEIKRWSPKRSKDANAYLWVILQKMAEVLYTSKDELYLEMLSRYGVFTHIVVKPSVIDRVKTEWRTVRELGEVTINGQTGIQLQCFFGSHTYDTKEFSVLLDGVVSEAKEIGVEVMTPQEIESLKQAWGRS